MGRLKQLNPNNYGASAQISADIENIIRYLVSAERGNKTINEMLGSVFDENGDFGLGIEFRYESDGLSYSVSGSEWTNLVPASSIRGEPGRDVGDVALPIINARVDLVATAGQTVFNYAFISTDNVFVFHNGLILTPTTDYTLDDANNQVTLLSACADGDIVTIYRTRKTGGVAIQRTDTTVTVASQSVFGLVYPTSGTYQEVVYLNGVLLAETIDYVKSEGTSSLTLIDPAIQDDVLTVIFLSSDDDTTVTGFMLEGIFTDAQTGLIPYAKLGVADGQIPQAKVAGLVDHISTAAKITISASTPVSPQGGDLWLDTSQSPNQLKFHDGTQFLTTRPSSTLPTFTSDDANHGVFVNSTGTGYTYKALDFSALVYKATLGVPNGVAILDADGFLAPNHIPPVRATVSEGMAVDGAVANGTYQFRRLYGEKVRIVGLSAALTSGTCTIQLSVSGVAVGNTYAVSSTASDQLFGSAIEVDALTLSKALAVVVTGQASADTLSVTLIVERLN